MGALAEGPPAPSALADAVPAGLHFCRTLGVRAPAAQVREALAERRFSPDTTTAAWHGRLEGLRTTALLLDAQPALAFVHLWTEAAPGSEAMKMMHIAARALRGEIESAPPLA